jgi:hypothetical protein
MRQFDFPLTATSVIEHQPSTKCGTTMWLILIEPANKAGPRPRLNARGVSTRKALRSNTAMPSAAVETNPQCGCSHGNSSRTCRRYCCRCGCLLRHCADEGQKVAKISNK